MNGFFKTIVHFFYPKKILWISVLTFLPIFLVLSILLSNYQEFQKNKSFCSSLIEKILSSKEQRESKMDFIQNFKQSNPYFLQKELESIVFRKKELSLLQFLLNHPAFMNSSALYDRAFFLNEKNHLRFEQLFSNKETFFTESEEKSLCPIEIDEEDLFSLLSYLEGVSINHYPSLASRPFILIKKLQVKKAKGFSENQTLFLTLTLLKKDFNNE